MFYTPLEQFEIKVIQPGQFYNLIDISFTNSSSYMALSSLLAFCLLKLAVWNVGRKEDVEINTPLVPSRLQSIAEILYDFVQDMIKQQAGHKGLPYFPMLFTIFTFILFANLIGLLPLGFTTTGHLAVTLCLALGFNIGFLLFSFINHGIHFLKFFVPNDAPPLLLPLIVIIEIMSYALRTLSLSIRLFANMMAGHTLLFILSSFVLAFLNSTMSILAIVPFILVLAVIGLEFGIAFLQAYVFTILLAIYLNDSLNMAH